MGNWYKYESICGLVDTEFGLAQIAGISARPFNYLFDTVRRRIQMESEKPMEQRLYKGTIDCARVILQKEGLTGMYKGMLADIARGGFAAILGLVGLIFIYFNN